MLLKLSVTRRDKHHYTPKAQLPVCYLTFSSQISFTNNIADGITDSGILFLICSISTSAHVTVCAWNGKEQEVHWNKLGLDSIVC